MTSSMTSLEACTDEELEQKLARVLAYASGETLNDAEMQEFHQLYVNDVADEFKLAVPHGDYAGSSAQSAGT